MSATANKLWSIVQADDGSTPENIYDFFVARKRCSGKSTILGHVVAKAEGASSNTSTSSAIPASIFGSKTPSLAAPERKTTGKHRREDKDMLVDCHACLLQEEVEGWAAPDYLPNNTQWGGAMLALGMGAAALALQWGFV